MLSIEERIHELIIKYLEENLSLNEARELDHWIHASPNNKALFEELTNPGKLRRLLNEWQESEKYLQSRGIISEETKIISFQNRRRRNFWIAAASITFLITTCAYLYFRSDAGKKQIEITTTSPVILPANGNAILTLSNGKQLILENLADGELKGQEASAIYKSGEKLSYTGGSPNGEIAFNTISTAKGKQYQVQLSDGSRIWMNAQSSMTFPVSFPENERIIEVEGEIYLEVAKNVNKPFKVKANNTVVEVKGTHFNVSAYKEDDQVQVTLIEGSVLVSTASRHVILQPSEQSITNRSGHIEKNEDANVQQAIAWTRGEFYFHDTTLGSIFREISRWYDIQLRVEGVDLNKRLVARISRNSSLDEVLNILSATDLVHFKRENNNTVLALP